MITHFIRKQCHFPENSFVVTFCECCDHWHPAVLENPIACHIGPLDQKYPK
jgi:hypothetical protein